LNKKKEKEKEKEPMLSAQMMKHIVYMHVVQLNWMQPATGWGSPWFISS